MIRHSRRPLATLAIAALLVVLAACASQTVDAGARWNSATWDNATWAP